MDSRTQRGEAPDTDLTVFISYRRSDTEGYAGRLYEVLRRRLGARSILMDVDTMRPGEDFVRALESAVARSDVLLAVIGPDWLTATDDEGRRRLDDELDYVRVEIASALERGKLVIPLLVEGAPPPRQAALPEPLKSLSRRHAVVIRHDRFTSDVADLATELKRIRDEKRRHAAAVAEHPAGSTSTSELDAQEAVVSVWKGSPASDSPAGAGVTDREMLPADPNAGAAPGAAAPPPTPSPLDADAADRGPTRRDALAKDSQAVSGVVRARPDAPGATGAPKRPAAWSYTRLIGLAAAGVIVVHVLALSSYSWFDLQVPLALAVAGVIGVPLVARAIAPDFQTSDGRINELRVIALALGGAIAGHVVAVLSRSGESVTFEGLVLIAVGAAGPPLVVHAIRRRG